MLEKPLQRSPAVTEEPAMGNASDDVAVFLSLLVLSPSVDEEGGTWSTWPWLRERAIVKEERDYSPPFQLVHLLHKGEDTQEFTLEGPLRGGPQEVGKALLSSLFDGQHPPLPLGGDSTEGTKRRDGSQVGENL